MVHCLNDPSPSEVEMIRCMCLQDTVYSSYDPAPSVAEMIRCKRP